MAQFVLEILDGDRAGEVVSLGDRPVRIGRKPANDVVLHDEKASGVHAEVAFEGDRYVLRDLGSTNGTLMEGRKVTEVVLGGGDTFAIGRVRMRFRSAEAEAAPTGEFAVERIDAARLQAARSKSRPTGLLLLALLAAAGAGGYLWWRSGATGEDGANAARPRAAEIVAGNKLAQEVAACEAETGWDLRVAGAGFRGSVRAHTGSGALEAARAEGGAADGEDFAVCATSGELRVLAGRTLAAAAQLRTENGGRVALRLLFWSSTEGNPFRFRTGTAFASPDGWERAAVSAAVPTGADRCRIEIAALLPKEGSAALVDDVAVLEAGQETPLERKVGENATLLATGQSFAVRSMDPDQPATLLAVLPGDVAPELRGLRAAGQLALSDVGATVAADGDDRSAKVTVTGCNQVELVFPLESQAGLLAQGEAGFAGVEAQSTFQAQQVLLGDHSTRCVVALDAPAQISGSVLASTYRLSLPVATFGLVVGFRQERSQARELLRTAEDAHREQKPGQALDTLRELLRTVPHDAETLAAALARRAEWQEALSTRLRALAGDLEEAMFFETRGGFERVIAQLDEVVAAFGQNNVEDPQAVAAMRSTAATRLAELDAGRNQDQKQRLQKMATAFEQAQQPGLATLVRDYVAQQFGSDGGGSPEKNGAPEKKDDGGSPEKKE